MEKIVVISSNNNPDYLFYLPYMVKAWRSYGWKVACICTHDVDMKDLRADYLIQLPEIKGLRLETQAQASRLYAGNYLPEDSFIMTADMDMLPLSDYWHPEDDRITVYGHDLTWHSFFPICYIAMPCWLWKNVMKLTMNTERDMLRDASDPSLSYSPYSNDWEQWWNFDWDLVTKRIRSYTPPYNVTHIKRGQVEVGGGTLALGRVDRFNWNATLEHCEKTTFIDAHLENNNTQHPVKLNPFLSLYEKFYGKL